MSGSERYDRMVTRSSWGRLWSPGRGREETSRELWSGLGLGETNVRLRGPVGLCNINLAIDLVSIFGGPKIDLILKLLNTITSRNLELFIYRKSNKSIISYL